MCYKKGSDLYSIPFDIPFAYTPPQIDSVPQSMQVKPLQQTGGESIEEAVQLYLEAFGEQFNGEFSLNRKRQWLGRFVTYLQEQGHSMKLADLTLEDGQGFLDSLAHAYQGHQMSPQTKKRYKCAVRSFGRFLYNSKYVQEDVFFNLRSPSS